ncbi:MAG TPA: HNH endonuclease [Pyrinomonadaceae bacterium]
MFRNLLFYVDNIYNDDETKEEIILNIKKLAYSEDQKLKRLRQEVDAMERLASGIRGVKREPIPDSVKLIVWMRDEGKCVRCGSGEKLHFDHIIPIVKGGGNSEDNIQILCERCNLQKSDKIAF